MIFIERFQVFRYRILFIRTFGNEHRHGMRQAQPWCHQKLQHIIQRSAIAHPRLNDRTDTLNVADGRRGEYAFTRFHPSPIPADRIDLSVMSQQAERLCQAPGRKCVRTEAGVNQCQPACKVVICQVREVMTELHGFQHSFIYNIPGR